MGDAPVTVYCKRRARRPALRTFNLWPHLADAAFATTPGPPARPVPPTAALTVRARPECPPWPDPCSPSQCPPDPLPGPVLPTVVVEVPVMLTSYMMLPKVVESGSPGAWTEASATV